MHVRQSCFLDKHRTRQRVWIVVASRFQSQWNMHWQISACSRGYNATVQHGRFSSLHGASTGTHTLLIETIRSLGKKNCRVKLPKARACVRTPSDLLWVQTESHEQHGIKNIGKNTLYFAMFSDIVKMYKTNENPLDVKKNSSHLPTSIIVDDSDWYILVCLPKI